MVGPLGMILPVAVLVCFVLALRRRQRLVASAAAHPGLASRDALTLRARAVGIVAGVGLVIVCHLVLGLGRTVFAAPALLGLCVLGALVWAEAATWRSAQTPGVASLETRVSSRYLPRALLTSTLLALAGLIGLLWWCRNRQGADGRSWVWTSPDGFSSQSGSPFPGSFYALPLSIALGLCCATAAIALGLALRRPRNGADPVVAQVDDDARGRSCEAIVAALALAVFGCAMTSLTLATSAIEFFHDPDAARRASRSAWWIASVLGSSVLMLAGAWALAVLLVPGSPRKVEP